MDPLRRWIVITADLLVNAAPMNMELFHCHAHVVAVRTAVGCWHTECSRRATIKSLRPPGTQRTTLCIGKHTDVS
jgi:hypothetical protein